MQPVPSSVRVGPHIYRILSTQEAIDRCRIELGDDDRTGGRCREASLTITLDPQLAPSLFREVLLHETLHAVQYTANIATRDRLPAEELIGRLTPLLLGVLRDNHELVVFLTTVNDEETA